MDGENLILSESFGRSSYQCVEGTSHVKSGELYLVYQMCDSRSRFTGGMMVTFDPVSEDVAMAVCNSHRLTGSLSVYTLNRDDARQFTQKCFNLEPREYSFTGPQFSLEFANWRHPVRYRNDFSGPMCLYGESKGSFSSSLFDDERRLGFTHKNGRMVLALDLGGFEIPVIDLDDWDHVIEPGSFHIVIGLPNVLSEGTYMQSLVSLIDIPRDVALSICSDTQRFGYLNIYTPNRQDAYDLMFEAIGNHAPRELVSRRIFRFKASMFVNPKLNESVSPKAMYGDINS